MEKASGTERVMEFGRNVNIAFTLGFAALSLAAPAAIVGVYWNGAQAGGFEVGRRWAKNAKRKNKPKTYTRIGTASGTKTPD